MSGGYFSYVLLAALATALLVASLTDLRRREIDNGLNLAIAAAAPLWWFTMGFGWFDVAIQIALAAITFTIGCIFFAMRQMGGGDVKLLTALSLWFTPASFTQVIVLMAVIGGGASVAMAAFNMKRVAGESLRNGLAFGAAGLWVWSTGALALALATHRPVISQGTISAVAKVMPQAWILALALVTLLAISVFGLTHMVRRQRKRLPVPYGIAIAAAGLWVLGDQTLAAASLAGGFI